LIIFFDKNRTEPKMITPSNSELMIFPFNKSVKKTNLKN
jgi:hypothetical protein